MINNKQSFVSESVEAAVYRFLRETIVKGQIPGGERIYPREYAERLGVSETPVRQALRRLETESLVITRLRRGSIAAPLDPEEFEEIQAIRHGVEGVLARRGAVAATDQSIAAMEARFAAIERASEARDLDGYLSAQAAFRDSCYGLAARPRLHRIATEQRGRAERYLRYLCRDTDALGESREHQHELLDACRARDGTGADESTSRALAWTLKRVIALLELQRLSAVASDSQTTNTQGGGPRFPSGSSDRSRPSARQSISVREVRDEGQVWR